MKKVKFISVVFFCMFLFVHGFSQIIEEDCDVLETKVLVEKGILEELGNCKQSGVFVTVEWTLDNGGSCTLTQQVNSMPVTLVFASSSCRGVICEESVVSTTITVHDWVHSCKVTQEFEGFESFAEFGTDF